eukprot:TRINITY_DN15825_c0_g2_i1.p1 TRINITY_DN15825_c0_g2~~TRINITY_DN15825_c0_g2_i1.p1  ORF type:complete len:901 (+),score=299.45 TRINITY_DN15825_c0_g2_i1:88-2703(+)
MDRDAAEAMEGSAEAVVNALLEAMDGECSDEDAVIAALANVTSQQVWDTVASHFQARNGRDLPSTLRQELSSEQRDRILGRLRRAGINPMGAAAEAARAIEAVAASLQRSLKGIGSDEERTLAILRSIPDAQAFDKVQAAFSKQFPTFHGGDLRAALLAELPKEAIDRCRRTMARKGVALADETREAAARVAAIAESIFKAVSGMTTDEEAILSAVGEIQSAKDWRRARRYYRQRYGSELATALRLELTDAALRRCAAALQPAGIELDIGDAAAGGDDAAGTRRGAAAAAGFGDTVFDAGFDALPEARLGTQELIAPEQGGEEEPADGKWKCAACGTRSSGRPGHTDGARKWCAECWGDWDAEKALDGLIIYSAQSAQAALIAAMECGDDASSSEGERDRIGDIAFKDFPLMIESAPGAPPEPSGPCGFDPSGLDCDAESPWGSLRGLLASGGGVSVITEFLAPCCNDRTLLNFMLVCKAVRRAVDAEPMWRHRCLDRFGALQEGLPPPPPPPPGGVGQVRHAEGSALDESGGWKGRYAAFIRRRWRDVMPPLELRDHGFTVCSPRTGAVPAFEYRTAFGHQHRGPRRWVFHFRQQVTRRMPRVGLVLASKAIDSKLDPFLSLSTAQVWGIATRADRSFGGASGRLVAFHDAHTYDIVPDDYRWSVCSAAELELNAECDTLICRVVVGDPLAPGHRGPTRWRQFDTQLPFHPPHTSGVYPPALRPFAALVRGQSVHLPVPCWLSELGLDESDRTPGDLWRCASCGAATQGAPAHADGGRRWCSKCWLSDDWDGDKAWGEDADGAQGSRDGSAGALSWIRRLVLAAGPGAEGDDEAPPVAAAAAAGGSPRGAAAAAGPPPDPDPVSEPEAGA